MDLVIIINGKPYMKEGAIRRYKTIENARKWANRLKNAWYYKNGESYYYYRDTKIEIGCFSYDIIEEVK